MKPKLRFKLFSTLLVISMLLSSMGMFGVEASNWKDKTFSFWYNGDGGDVCPGGSRAKTDTTSVYIYNTTSTYSYLVNVYSTNKEAESNFKLLANCSINPWTNVSVGQSRYLTTWVYEWGYRYCTPVLTSTSHSASWMRGKWSPDSI